MERKLLYFGCLKDKGHYLFEHEGYDLGYHRANLIAKHFGINEKLLQHLDGIFTPRTTEQGVYLESIIQSVRIISWWDYSGDSRPGSNSSLIGINYASADEIIEDAKIKFPTAMNRQPEIKPL